MNTAELTALNTETLAEMRLEKTLANIARRAETLLQSGYTVNHNNRLDPYGVNYVHGPKGQLYRVDFWGGSAEFPIASYSCDCPAFATYGTCKHIQAVAILEAEEAQAAEHDAQAADRDAFYFDVNEYELRNFCEAVN